MAGRPLSPQERRHDELYHQPVLRAISRRLEAARGAWPDYHLQVRCKGASLALALADAKHKGNAVDGDPLWVARAQMNAGFYDIPPPMLSISSVDPISWPRVSPHCYAAVYSVDELQWMGNNELQMFLLGCFFLSTYNVHTIPAFGAESFLERLRTIDCPPTEKLKYRNHIRLEWDL